MLHLNFQDIFECILFIGFLIYWMCVVLLKCHQPSQLVQLVFSVLYSFRSTDYKLIINNVFRHIVLSPCFVCVYLQYDPDNSGFISTERFRDLLATHGSELDPHKLEVLLALADGNADGKICYQDFVNLVRCFNLTGNSCQQNSRLGLFLLYNIFISMFSLLFKF